MKREHIEQMISQIDENYIKEAMDMNRQASAENRKLSVKIEKWCAAAVIGVIILGAGITVTATASDAFGSWLTRIFGGSGITKVDIGPEETSEENTTADLPTDRNSHLSLSENTEIYGELESFVCQYHMKDEEMIMDEIYSIQNDGLKKMTLQQFHGTYDGVDFSFEYAVINHEIFGCNLTGDINKVFHYTDGEVVYVQLGETTNDVFTKGCIARLNLKTGTVEKITNDKTIGNMLMSPKGKMILINYRMDGYWTVFDIASRTEKKITEIDGYAYMNQVVFQDDYHVLTYGDCMEEDREIPSTKIIDLKTGQKTASYRKGGGYNPLWVYTKKNDCLTIEHVDGTVSIQIDGVKGFPQPLSYRGDYVLLKNIKKKKSPYYLCNLKEKTYMTIDPPSELKEDVNIYLAAREGKILLTDGKEAYLADIRKLG